MTEFESKCYGMTQQDIQDEYINSLTARVSGLEMVVAGILSDCQEMLRVHDNEHVRKQLNVAKYIVFQMLDKRRKLS